MLTQVTSSEIETVSEPLQSPAQTSGVGVTVGLAVRDPGAAELVRVGVAVRTGLPVRVRVGVRVTVGAPLAVGVNVLTGLHGTMAVSSIKLGGGTTCAPATMAGTYSGPA